MKNIFIKKIHIDKVRHLYDLDIRISDSANDFKNLVITGKNGSGKTSLLNALKGYLKSISTSNDPYEAKKYLAMARKNFDVAVSKGSTNNELFDLQKKIDVFKNRLSNTSCGLSIEFNQEETSLREPFGKGEYILAFFDAKRQFDAVVPKSIEKVEVKTAYDITEKPRSLFLKYMLDLKMTQALAASSGNSEKLEKADELQKWFDRIQQILRDIYNDESLVMDFDEETYRFIIKETDREPFDFNTASDGFSAVLDIVVDLILRMQCQDKRVVDFTKPGIVLIDEIENHLHLELQKRVLKYLTTLFPNIQFIVTTHSPFVLSSIENAVIYDLENHVTVKDGLSEYPYEGIVTGYFGVNQYSEELNSKFKIYKDIVKKDKISDQDFEEALRLENCLDEIPDYLSLDFAVQYSKLKTEFHTRSDLNG